MQYDFDKIVDRKGTESVKHDLLQAIFGRDDLLPMWVADMDFEVADFIREAMIDRMNHPVFGYTYRSDRFSSSVVSWLQRRHGWEVEPETICFSPGIVPALNMFVMEFTEPGDRIAVQPPVYFPFFNAIRNNNRELIFNQLIEKNGRYEMDFNQLEEQFRNGVKMLFLCHPHNPVGRAWRRDELELLAEMAVKYGVMVISDEIHSDLVLFGRKHVPLASLGKEISDLTITCVAPSKTFNLAGLYTSVVIAANPELRRRYVRILDVVHVGGDNILGQVALEAAYTHGDEWLAQLKKYLEQNYKMLCKLLSDSFPEITVSPLEATYLAWLDLSFLNKNDADLKSFIINHARLGLNDGPVFGPGGEKHQRMNIAAPARVIREAAILLIEAIRADR